MGLRRPDLPMSLLYAEEGDGFADVVVCNEGGTAENTLDVATVGYPTVWSFLSTLGYDFGWEHPGNESYDLDAVPVIG